ncbi:MAG: hypothetical protein HA496_07395 [Thaumarchaeota archaeon]|nr:hypothetical protein [Nitrososphaerota archaeon]
MVFETIFTNKSIDGASHRGPTTVARAAPELTPNTSVAVAIATSNWLRCVKIHT